MSKCKIESQEPALSTKRTADVCAHYNCMLSEMFLCDLIDCFSLPYDTEIGEVLVLGSKKSKGGL